MNAPIDAGARFRALHVPGEPFTLANAWDVGSARVLVALGARAIGTTSAGHAFTLGRPDGGTVRRDEALAHGAELVRAVDVPVSADLENGFDASPDEVAETVRLAAGVGLAGLSIEDVDLPSDDPYPFELAVERVRAGVAAARALDRDLVFCARADGLMHGRYGIDEAVRRIEAFDAAGADCLYAPLPGTLEDLERICRCTAKPVNALVAGPFWTGVTRARLAAAGVARLSLGSSLARVAHRALVEAGRAALVDGDHATLGDAADGGAVGDLLRAGTPRAD